MADAFRVHVRVFEKDRLIDDSVLIKRDDGLCVRLDASGRETARYRAQAG